ncbi:MAG: hypothetical protein HYV37_01660 [Candidatus Levyibacteriota bacterium]|nr:MAG: hypothetical protein HYV37_01660 [Candidatus Levybacteria bacterium]
MFLKFLHHFFLPHESNNHRPKVLHHTSLMFFIFVFLVGQIMMGSAKANFGDVLGAKIDVSVERLLQLTNDERQNKGLRSLLLNDKLSKAAFLKGTYMLQKNYWAHNAPDGTTPWVFIRQTKYDYVYAGENLARGFTNSSDVVKAWMESPTHRDNMLSTNYKDIGFSVLEGKLLGEDTTLVVEMFGSTEPMVLGSQPEKTIPSKEVLPQIALEKVINTPVFDISLVSRYVGIATLALFIFIFVIDLIIIERRKIVRLVGHNLDHITFLFMILLFIILFNRGSIL